MILHLQLHINTLAHQIIKSKSRLVDHNLKIVLHLRRYSINKKIRKGPKEESKLPRKIIKNLHNQNSKSKYKKVKV